MVQRLVLSPLLLLVVFLLCGGFETTTAFVHKTAVSGRSRCASTTSSRLSMVTTKQPPAIPDPDPQDIAYGEESRKYRRDVFSHADWVKYRSQNRFVRNLNSIFYSGIYKGVFKEVMVSVSVATLVVLYNTVLMGEYSDFQGVQHAGLLQESLASPLLSIPLTPFTLSAPSLGLLLVFRNNKSYKRWDEARKNWGMNINHSRDLVRMASAYYDRTDVPRHVIQQDLERVALNTWAFVRAMKRHLSPEEEDEEMFRQEVKQKLPAQQAEKLLSAQHRPNRALQDLSVSIEALPMNILRKNEVQRAATIFEDNLGSSERLLTSPIPLVYSRHSARFLALWLFLLPLGLYGQFGGTWNHLGLIPATAAIATAFFGIEELATQLEEPFTILPMQAFCDKIYNWVTEIVTWEPNDCGMFTEEYLAEVAAWRATQTEQATDQQQFLNEIGVSAPTETSPTSPTSQTEEPQSIESNGEEESQRKRGPVRRLKSLVLGRKATG